MRARRSPRKISRPLGLLLNAGIHVSVLVSKADLLASADLDATLTYARQVLVREFNTTIPVAAVSVKPEFDHLFAQWRTQELAPLVADQERERQQAAARKMAILRAQIEARLRQSLAAGERGPRCTLRRSGRPTSRCRRPAGQITDLERRIDALTLVLPRQAPDVLRRAAALISDKVPSRQALMQAFREVTGDAAQDVARDLQTLAASLSDVHRRVAQTLDRSDRTPRRWNAQRRSAKCRFPICRRISRSRPEGAERLFGRGLARSVVLKRLERRVGDAVRTTLESYAAVLRRWALDALEDIRSQWTATTDGARAELDRRMGHAQNRPIDARDLQRDLDRLAVSALR